jgi:hypothetical protein
MDEAKRLLNGTPETLDDEARTLIEMVREEGRRNTRIVLALVSDEYTPAELFKPWACVRRIRDWRDDPAVKLDVIVRHGRCCVKPSAFFKHWNSLQN